MRYTREGTVSVGRPDHMLTEDVTDMVNARYGRHEVTDACAVTIASWWQSSSPYGMPFTALSTTGTVDYRELADAIYRERKGLHDGTFDAKALDMLSTWALAKVREGERRKCRKCKLPIVWSGDAWVVTGTDTTGDGLSYCPPNPDAARVGNHLPAKAE